MPDKTEFSVFAGNLSVYFQRDNDPIEFTRQLFAHIHKGCINKKDPFVDDLDERVLKGYYYSEHDITTVAKHIAGDLDLGAFAEFVHLDAEDSIVHLCKTFKDTCPSINESTYGMELAERFQSIINVAAKGKRKSKKKKSELMALADKQSLVVSTKDKYGVFLVAEAGSICPVCRRKPLFSYGDGRNELIYDVAVIDPDLPCDDISNLIALCPECSATYLALRTPMDICRMQENKRALLDAFDNQELIADQRVQEGVKRVIEKIPLIQMSEGLDLNYVPVPIRQKIEMDNTRLFLTVKTQVNVYFKDVHEAFQQMGREGKLRFNAFCQQVKYMYVSFRDKGYDQNKIFYEMTRWLSDATGEAWGDCEVVISYFVQKCEVFDVIAG